MDSVHWVAQVLICASEGNIAAGTIARLVVSVASLLPGTLLVSSKPHFRFAMDEDPDDWLDNTSLPQALASPGPASDVSVAVRMECLRTGAFLKEHLMGVRNMRPSN